MRLEILVGVCLVGCGGSSPRVANAPRTWSEHVALAQQHEQNAEKHSFAAFSAETTTRDPESYHCGDEVLNEQITSGTEQLTNWMPCFNSSEEARLRGAAAANRELGLAQKNREQAAALVRAEERMCSGIPEQERNHAPLEHRTAIDSVIPHREGGQLRGVRVQLKPVPGLTADYMRRAIACAQARRDMYGPAFGGGDPSLVPGSEVIVSERAGRVEVLVLSGSSTDAQIALDRALDREPGLPQTAAR
jgi:hypothetical protein